MIFHNAVSKVASMTCRWESQKIVQGDRQVFLQGLEIWTLDKTISHWGKLGTTWPNKLEQRIGEWPRDIFSNTTLMFSYPLLDLCLVKLFLVFPQWLMVSCKVHISNPWRKLIYYLELSYDFLIGPSCLLPYSLQQGRSSWDREDRWS